VVRPDPEPWPLDDDVVAGGGWSWRALLMTLIVTVLVLAVAVIALARFVPSVRSMLPFGDSGPCVVERVEVVTAPEILGAVQQILEPIQGEDLNDGHCLTVLVRGQDSAETIAGAAVLPQDRWPDVWVPDSSLWLAQQMPFTTAPATRFASSPIVLATNGATAQRLGWNNRPPTWAQALTGNQQVAIPQLTSGATGLAAVLALRASLKDGPEADQAVAAAVLAANRTSVGTISDAMARNGTGTPGAPVTPLSEQDIVTANDSARSPQTIAVYPADGSPALDYPVLRVSPERFSSNLRHAVDAVVDAFDVPTAAKKVRAAGFRDVDGAGPKAFGIGEGQVKTLELPQTLEVQEFVKKLAELAQPSRLLVAVDVSTSMRDPASNGLSRIELAAASAVRTGDLLPGRSSVGLWIFATKLDGAKGYREVEPLAPLDSSDGKVTHKLAVQGALAALPANLSPGGTALYDTALAATRAARAQYDPDAANSVVVFTDGKNDEPDGITLQTLLQQLKADAQKEPDKKVRLITIGLGPGVDLPALTAMSQATGGQAFRAQTADEMKAVLFAAMNAR
jgi:hypothetical protein